MTLSNLTCIKLHPDTLTLIFRSTLHLTHSSQKQSRICNELNIDAPYIKYLWYLLYGWRYQPSSQTWAKRRNVRYFLRTVENITISYSKNQVRSWPNSYLIPEQQSTYLHRLTCIWPDGTQLSNTNYVTSLNAHTCYQQLSCNRLNTCQLPNLSLVQEPISVRQSFGSVQDLAINWRIVRGWTFFNITICVNSTFEDWIWRQLLKSDDFRRTLTLFVLTSR